MKKDTHPQFYTDTKITCACGNSFTTGSTIKDIHVEICSMCHPFFTGKQKLLDDRGRVERFQRLMAKKNTTSARNKKQKQAARASKKTGKRKK